MAGESPDRSEQQKSSGTARRNAIRGWRCSANPVRTWLTDAAADAATIGHGDGGVPSAACGGREDEAGRAPKARRQDLDGPEEPASGAEGRREGP